MSLLLSSDTGPVPARRGLNRPGEQVVGATPRFINAEVSNETLQTCTFNFWKVGPSGLETNYFRIDLTDAHVVSYRLNGVPGGHDTVSFTLTYSHIKWTYVSGGIVASDVWQNLA